MGELNLRHALRLTDAPRVAFVGAGGKTTALFRLARQFAGPVILTATTHLATSQLALADHHFAAVSPEDVAAAGRNLPGGVMLFTGAPAGDSRAAGVGEDVLARLHALAQARQIPLLIEADGSRMRPLKAPAEYEPLIPPFVDTVVVVAGMRALGQPLTLEHVHRPARFAALAGIQPDARLTPEVVARVLAHPAGGLKSIPPGARRVALLNQADTPAQRAAAGHLAQNLVGAYDAALVASLRREGTLWAAREPIAGVVLAAGGARRFGQPKQVLAWQGKPLVQRVVETALAAGLWPVVVVTGAYAQQVTQAVAGLPVEVVHNAQWEAGQSSSVRVGVSALPDAAGGAVFLLADQPTIPPTLIRSLTERHAQTLAPVIAPLIDGQRGNPVLFDRATFEDFAHISGDRGGRALFSRYPITWLPWHDPRPLFDVDTWDDYQKLTEAE